MLFQNARVFLFFSKILLLYSLQNEIFVLQYLQELIFYADPTHPRRLLRRFMSKRERTSEILVSLLKACAYALAFYFSQVALGIALSIIMPKVTDDFLISRSMELSIISNLISVVLCVLLMRGLEKKSTCEGFSLHFDMPKPAVVLGLSIAVGVFLQYVVSFVINTATLPSAWLTELEESSALLREGTLASRIIALAIVAPLAEEIIFRACIQGTLSRAMNKWVAISISSLVFGVAHGHTLGIITAIIIGFLLGWLYAQLGSIFPSMLLHLAYNLTSIFLNRLNLVIFIISCVCLVLGIGYLIYIGITHSKKGENDEAL